MQWSDGEYLKRTSRGSKKQNNLSQLCAVRADLLGIFSSLFIWKRKTKSNVCMDFSREHFAWDEFYNSKLSAMSLPIQALHSVYLWFHTFWKTRFLVIVHCQEWFNFGITIHFFEKEILARKWIYLTQIKLKYY